ncbi:autotransporter domain-containing protein [Croceibacterium xixiisoli]|nr:autotransporter outer membrane beta-barrel domain-containing protein [Croceibacterium xixiisoli]
MAYSATQTITRRLHLALLARSALTLPLIAPASAQAQQVWDGSTDADFGKADNWDTGVMPNATSLLVIASDNTAVRVPVVGAGQDFNIRELTVGRGEDGTLTIAANGRLQLGSSGSTAGAGTLTIGDTLSPFGVINASEGRVNVDGGVLDVNGTTSIGNGFGSTGRLMITNGGVARTASLCLGCGNPNFAGFGYILVEGAGSRFELAGPGQGLIGNGGQGGGTAQFVVRRGGKLLQTANSVSGLSVGALSSLTVSDAGSEFDLAAPLLVNGDLGIMDGADASIGALTVNGSLLVVDGAVLQQRDGDGNNWNFGQQAGVRIGGIGTRVRVNGALDIGGSNPDQPAADFLVEDHAVLQVLSTSPSALSFGAHRNLTIRNNAQVTLTGGLSMGHSTLTVRDATLTMSGPLDMAGLFAGNITNLFNADFSATSIQAGANATQGASIINLGGAAEGPAGAIGQFTVGRITLNGVDDGPAAELVINHTNGEAIIAADITGNGGIVRHVAGNTILTGTNLSGTFNGQTLVTGGSLAVNGNYGGGTHVMQVSGGARLGGSGRIDGDVTLADATLAPGNSVDVLTFGGSLTLGTDSVLAFELGSPFGAAGIDSDLIEVTGNLVLDGQIDIIDTGAFGPGLYRLISYGGTLTDRGMEIGATPGGVRVRDLTIQTDVANQINLILAEPGSYTFWDGVDQDGNNQIDARDGVWTASATNWTTSDGRDNGAFLPDSFLIFGGPTSRPDQRLAAVPSATAGLVTVDDTAGPVRLANGVQFAVDGYTVTGDDIVLDATIPCGECSPLPGSVIMRVGDGSNAGAAFVATIDARLTGEAGLTKTDLGTLILLGANNYTGGTIVSEGTLQGNSTSLQGDIAIETEGLLLFDQATSGSYAGVLSGAGGIIKEGAGTLALTGDSSGFNGGTSLTEGTLLVNGTLGNGEHRFNAGDGAILGGTGTIGGVANLSDAILAPGALPGGPNNGVGHLTFAGNLNLNSETILSFQLGAPDGAAGVASDLVTVGGNLSLNGTLNIVDAGGFGSGVYRLFNYGGELFGFGLEIGDTPEGVLASDLAIQTAIENQVNLVFNAAPADSFTFWDGGDVDGNGRIDAGSGTWTAARSNWTTINGSANGAYDPADFLIFGGPTTNQQTRARVAAAAVPSSTAGLVTVDDAAGAVTLANGVQFAVGGYTVTGDAIGLAAPAVVFRVGDGSDAGAEFTATIASALTGTGGIDKTDLGTLILTGTNTYSGGSRVTDGTLQGNATSLQGPIAVATNGTLLFDQAGAGTYAGVLSGTGTLRKEGAGVLGLSGNSGGFTGGAELAAGGIALTGTLGTATNGVLTTAAGTTLTGNGTLGNLDLGGTIAPNAGQTATGRFNISGDLIVRGGASFLVDVAASGAGDRIQVGGTAVLEGGTVVVNALDPGVSYTNGTVYRILDAAGGRSGTFAGLSESSAFLDFTLGYDPTGAFLTTSVIAQFPDVALTFNQRQASLGLQDLGQTAGSDSLEVYNAILLLDATQARAAFDMASGEIYADIVAGGQRAAKQRGGAALRRGLEPGREGLQAWIGGGITRSRVSGDGNGARFTNHGEALELGVDYHGADDRFAAGISGGWVSNDVSNDDRRSRADLDGWFISGFARYGDFGPGLTLGGAVSHADSDGTASRSIGFGTISRATSAQVDHRATALTGELRYGFGQAAEAGKGGWAFGPSLAIDHAWSKLDGFAESGAGALDLSSGGISDSSTRYAAGAFASWRADNARLVIDVRYAKDSNDDLASELRLAGSPRAFTILPARNGGEGVQIAGSGSVDLGSNLSIGAQGGAFLADGANDVSASGWLRWKF